MKLYHQKVHVTSTKKPLWHHNLYINNSTSIQDLINLDMIVKSRYDLSQSSYSVFRGTYPMSDENRFLWVNSLEFGGRRQFSPHLVLLVFHCWNQYQLLPNPLPVFQVLQSEKKSIILFYLENFICLQNLALHVLKLMRFKCMNFFSFIHSI